MTHPQITIRRLPGTWVVRAGGAVLAETQAALELTEGHLPPVVYFPRADAGMAFLEPSNRVTVSGSKGPAVHFDLVVKSGVIRDAALSYETPPGDFARIAGYVAYDPAKATVERV